MIYAVMLFHNVMINYNKKHSNMEALLIPPSSPAKLLVGAGGFCGTALPPTKDSSIYRTPKSRAQKTNTIKALGDGVRGGRCTHRPRAETHHFSRELIQMTKSGCSAKNIRTLSKRHRRTFSIDLKREARARCRAAGSVVVGLRLLEAISEPRRACSF